MKKISAPGKFCGFSLAEALITLLIVCLITLASIPILTKKRRSADNGAHGKYYCTLNKDGNYVEFYTNTSSGDVNDPQTWDLVQNTGFKDQAEYTNSDGQVVKWERAQCRFVPPMNARNFNVTVIGGGAGGHDGSVEYIPLLNATTAGSGSFVPKENSDFYDVILVAGGGGGGGSPRDWNNGHAGYGGGGGSGAYIRAEQLKLEKYGTYKYTIGGGGGGVDGSMHGCCKPNKTDHARAGNGGTSTFEGTNNGKTVEFSVPGGQGGDSIGCSKKKCRGGGLGSGGSSSSITANYSYYSGQNVRRYPGKNGTGGSEYCSNCGTKVEKPGGINDIESFQVDENNFPIIVHYGGGGSGYGIGATAVRGDNGQSGALIISQNKKLYGNGGNAGSIQSRFVPSIEGYIVASIPLAAQPNKAGGNVRATLYKNKTNNGVLVQASGGATPTTNTTEPTAGGDSPWTYENGGAAAGKCSSVRTESAHNETITHEVAKCRKVACELDDDYDVTFLQANNKKSIASDTGTTTSVELPAGLLEWSTEETAYADAYYETLPLSNASGTKLDAYLAYLNIYYLTSDMATAKIRADHADLETYENKSDFDDVGCFVDENKLSYIKVCSESYMDTTKETISVEGRRTQDCPAGGNGTDFGAGGGGGHAGDIAGIYGKGGKGAPGAMIIEW